LIFLFVCLVCLQADFRGIIKVIWPTIIALATLFLVTCYIYQFPDIHNYIQERVKEEYLHDLGLEVNPPPQLFLYLLKVALSLLFSFSIEFVAKSCL